MVENKIFIGNGNIISLILQDELLHKGWTAYIINQVIKDDSRFASIKQECEGEVYALYADVIREEKAWADYLFNKGPVIGLNANVLKDFVVSSLEAFDCVIEVLPEETNFMELNYETMG
jgi:ribonucleoside-diphosphate reductase beta chain